MHSTQFRQWLFCLVRQNNCGRVILLSAEQCVGYEELRLRAVALGQRKLPVVFMPPRMLLLPNRM